MSLVVAGQTVKLCSKIGSDSNSVNDNNEIIFD